MSRVVILAIAICAVVASATSSVSQCEQQQACKPYPSYYSNGQAAPKCAKGDRMDLRFMLEIPYSRWYQKSLEPGVNVHYPERVNISGTTIDYPVAWPYFFCPIVDELQAFTLYNASQLTSTGYYNDTWTTLNSTRLSVYGMGNKGSPRVPEDYDDSSVMIYQNTSLCGNVNGSAFPAIVDFLVLNITMTTGEYLYKPSFEQAIQVGFEPTCDSGDICKLGSGVCIGDKPGRKNCAKCMYKPDDVKNAHLKVWTSYYGTDKNGRAFLSGSSNPLAFKQFSATPIFDAVAKDVTNIGSHF